MKKTSRTFRRIRAISVLSAIAIGIMSYTVSNVEHDKEAIPDEYKQVNIVVREGQTAWEIQSELTPNEDVREILHYASIANGGKIGRIMAGEELVFLERR